MFSKDIEVKCLAPTWEVLLGLIDSGEFGPGLLPDFFAKHSCGPQIREVDMSSHGTLNIQKLSILSNCYLKEFQKLNYFSCKLEVSTNFRNLNTRLQFQQN